MKNLFTFEELKLILESLNALLDDDNEEYNEDINKLIKKINNILDNIK